MQDNGIDNRLNDEEERRNEMESGGDEAGPFLCYLLLLTGTWGSVISESALL